MKELTSQVLVDKKLVFGEGPRWHEGKLWFSDIWGQRIMTADLEGNLETVVQVPERPSGLGWLPDGVLVFVSMADVKLKRFGPRGLEDHADLRPLFSGGINDMVVDARGNAYVGGHDHGRDRMLGKVVLVSPRGEARVVADEMGFPNGPVVTPDGGTYIVADTPRNSLVAFTVQEDGSLTGRRTFAHFTNRAVPDGICLDAEGAVWIGSFKRGEFLRVKDGGEFTHRVATPGRWSVACALGGDDGRTMFMMTALTSMEDLPKGKSIGSIETTRVDAPGAGWA
jgi:sugar lactone lactonase YvrE